MGARKCPGCQASMDADAIFCNECGRASPSAMEIDLGKASVSALPTEVSPSFTPPEPQPAPPPRESPAYGSPSGVDTGPNAPGKSAAFKKACSRCGSEVDSYVKYCPKCSFMFKHHGSDDPPSTATGLPAEVIDPAGSSDSVDVQVLNEIPEVLAQAMRKRYRDGYIYTRFLNSMGQVIIVVGILIGALGLSWGFLVGVAGGAGIGLALGLPILFMGALIGGLFALFGVIIRASAQLMMATLDSAVNGSPFLSLADQVEIMKLATTAPEKRSGDGVTNWK